jgi:sarcosine oxidase
VAPVVERTYGYARAAMERYDAIVIGGGAMGTAAARTLAERGRSTLLLERFTFGHGHGSSGGPTRIFRYNYAEPGYVAMVKLAAELWRELESAAGVELLRTTGGLDGGAAARGPSATVEASGVPIRRIHARDVTERWPALRFADDAELYLQDDSGVLRAADSVRAQASLARTAGADLREGARVTSLRSLHGGVEVETADGDAFAGGVAIVAAGSWAPDLLDGVGIDLPVVASLEQVTYFTLEDPQPLPTLIERWDDDVRADYTVPDPWELGSFKVGLHRGGAAVDLEPDLRPGIDETRLAHSRTHAAQRFAPHHETGTIDTCLYTITPDTHFVLDRVGPVVVASPCSGHGFKFVPLIGRVVADLATGRRAEISLEPFRLDRPALRR